MSLGFLAYPHHTLTKYSTEEFMASLSNGSLATMYIVVLHFGYVMASGVRLAIMMAVAIFGGARTRWTEPHLLANENLPFQC